MQREDGSLKQPPKRREKKKNNQSDHGLVIPAIIDRQAGEIKPSIESAAISPQTKPTENQAVQDNVKLEITDQLLLDTVRDQIFEKLIGGTLKLDIGDGFKAIEIKHKIADESQNERTMLEILNEIRLQELAK